MKKNRFVNWKLYVIADAQAAGKKSLTEAVAAAIRGGADVIQLRNKRASDEELLSQAKTLLEMTRAKGVPLIINDRVSVAKNSGAEGVHLGQEDGSIKEARAFLGENALIGRSTHSREQATEAQKEGADYIGVGPVFQTPTKPDTAPVGLELVRFASKNIHIPFVAIGGIDLVNVSEVRQAGAKMIAVVRAVIGSGDPEEASRRFLKELS